GACEGTTRHGDRCGSPSNLTTSAVIPTFLPCPRSDSSSRSKQSWLVGERLSIKRTAPCASQTAPTSFYRPPPLASPCTTRANSIAAASGSARLASDVVLT